MPIRNYQPGDEDAQARIFNTAAGRFPRFKPATAAEVARRYQGAGAAAERRFYAVEGDETVGYAVFDDNGRLSYPWCLPGSEPVRAPLLEAVLTSMKARGCAEARAVYRGDWTDVLDFFRDRGFDTARETVNYVAALARLPRVPVPAGQSLGKLCPDDWPAIVALGGTLFPDGGRETLGDYYRDNPYVDEGSLLVLREREGKTILGAAVVVRRAGYADPNQVDASMPCYRLGALGTERERHKRIDGMFSCVFADEGAAEVLLSEAAARLQAAGLTHMAAQAPSDVPALQAFYGRFFERQGAFPVLVAPLHPGPTKPPLKSGGL